MLSRVIEALPTFPPSPASTGAPHDAIGAFVLGTGVALLGGAAWFEANQETALARQEAIRGRCAGWE